MSKREQAYKSPIIEKLIKISDPKELSRTKTRMLLAARIDDALKAKGWKKKELAEALNKEPSVITRWLSGTHNFTSDTLTDISEVLEIKLLNAEVKPQEIVTHYQAIVLQQKARIGDENNDMGISIDQIGTVSFSEKIQLNSYLA